MNDASFKNAYQEAYNHIYSDKEVLFKMAEENRRGSGFQPVLLKKRTGTVYSLAGIVRSLAAAAALLFLLAGISLPAAAKGLPGVYTIIAKYAPMFTDFVLPEKHTSTSSGITMQVEAINLQENTAEILVSFSDAEESTRDLIKGKIDLYDSYHLQGYGSVSEIGGCHFLEYDASEDKAYFKIDVSTTNGSFGGKVIFQANQLLTESSKETREIPLENIIFNPDLKSVSVNGRSGSRDFVKQNMEKSEDSPLPGAKVMTLQPLDESMADSLAVTGVGYTNGFLRVQVCRGSFQDADRHARLYMTDGAGMEYSPDASVMWQETVNGKTLLMDESWFPVEEDELQNMKLYGDFYVTAGSVKGNWEVCLEVDKAEEAFSQSGQ